MAQSRRVVRKVDPGVVAHFDDQLWPVCVALLVLGGFVMGVVLAYLNESRWYWPCLLLTPVAVLGVMFGLRFINQRAARRAMQLSIVLSLLVNLALMLSFLQVTIFSSPPAIKTNELATTRPSNDARKPTYHPFHFETERQPFLFERPVETPTPDLPRDEPKKEDPVDPTPVAPDVEPTPRADATVMPRASKAAETARATPRHSPEQSKLSRQENRSRPRTDASARAEAPASNAPAETTQQTTPAAAAAPDKSQTADKAQPRSAAEATSEAKPESSALAKRASETLPPADATPTPTLTRQPTKVAVTPRATPLAETEPTPPKSDSKSEVRPQPTEVAKQSTTSPQKTTEPVEPPKETPQPREAAVTKPQLTTPQQPTLAEAPQSTPQPRARQTPRPVVAQVTPELTTPSASSTESARQPSLAEARSSPLEKSSTEPTAARRVPAETPDLAARPAPATPSRQLPKATSETAATRPPRETPAQQVAAEQNPTAVARAARATLRQPTTEQVAQVNPAPAETQATASVQPRSAEVARRQTSAEAVAKAAVEPQPPASQTTPDTSSPVARRQPRAPPTPQTAHAPVALPTPRASAQTQTAVSTTAAETIESQAPQTAALPQRQPVDANVSRQPTLAADAARQQQPRETPAQSTTLQTAQASPTRAQASLAPSLTPEAALAAQPLRSTLQSRAARSPTPIESPAAAQIELSAAQPSAQPASLALAKSQSGVAGLGASPNFDRALPAADSPAFSASGSRQHAKATQRAAPGPAFAPSEPAQLARSQSGAQTPSSTMAEQVAEAATMPSAAKPTETTASASAALARSDANAAHAEVTAAKGAVEVDMGATRVVSEQGRSRAAGGGQPEIHQESLTAQVRRAESGGAPLAALLAEQKADTIEAPAADGGGLPDLTAAVQSQALARTEPGASEPVTGGPAEASEQGPTAESSAAARLADTRVTRAEAAEAADGPTEVGGGELSDEDEEERKRRLARAASARAAGTLASAEPIEAPAGDAAGQEAAPAETGAASTRVAKAQTGAAAQATVDAPGDTAADAAASLAASAASRAKVEKAAGDPAEGGGQPSDATGAAVASRVARATGGGQPNLALAAAEPIDVSSAARSGSGVVGAVADEGRPRATAAPRTEPHGGHPPTGEVAAAEKTGPAADSPGGEQVASARLGRAEAAESAHGQPTLGGGHAAAQRSTSGRPFSASAVAEVAQVEGAPDAGGQPGGAPATLGVASARSGGAVAGRTQTAVHGAAAGPSESEGPVSEQSGAASRSLSRTSGAAGAGPEMVASDALGRPSRQALGASRLGAGAALAEEIDAGLGAGQPAATGLAAGDAPDLSGRGAVGKRDASAQGLQVTLNVDAGAGGLGDEAAQNVGYLDRRAQADSLTLEPSFARYDQRASTAKVASETSALVAAESFRKRGDREDGQPQGGQPGNSAPQTEESIELGLKFLARHQSPDGSWSLNNFGAGRPGYEDEGAQLHSDTAATGLALLAYQGAGYHHREHQYQDQVRRGLEWLLDHQQPNGDLYVPIDENSNRSVWIYSHSIAALALCEAYGMTQDPRLREPAQKSIDFLVEAQNPERGGWRYAPQRSSDTSVSGWAITAFKSAELARLNVPAKAFQEAEKWLDRSQASREEKHLYVYNPYAADTVEQRHGRQATPSMTAVGLLARMYLGWQRDNEHLAKGADYLAAKPPTMGYIQSPERDTYYWYYATQVMYHMGGKHWEDWNAKLHPLLVNTQEKHGEMAGSWNPRAYPSGRQLIPVADRWGPHGGRMYVTCMNLLSLEVAYRHLPLYEVTGGKRE